MCNRLNTKYISKLNVPYPNESRTMVNSSFCSFPPKGQFLLDAEVHFKSQNSASNNEPAQGRGRPTTNSMYEVLANTQNAIFSEAALRETTYVAMALSKFSLLSFVNEPISHFSSSLVRSSIQLLPDVLQESMNIPPNIGSAYSNISPYVLDVADIKPESLSPMIPIQKIIPNDGDGLVVLQEEHQLHDAIFHRLFAVDAPELYCTSFANSDDGHTRKRRNGHLSHLALHFYLNSFAGPNATGTIRREYPLSDEPKDKYNRPISSFWFVWLFSPNEDELLVIDRIQHLIQNHSASCRVMSGINPRDATPHNPFLLNLNALLVLSGFCHVYTRYSI